MIKKFFCGILSIAVVFGGQTFVLAGSAESPTLYNWVWTANNLTNEYAADGTTYIGGPPEMSDADAIFSTADTPGTEFVLLKGVNSDNSDGYLVMRRRTSKTLQHLGAVKEEINGTQTIVQAHKYYDEYREHNYKDESGNAVNTPYSEFIFDSSDPKSIASIMQTDEYLGSSDYSDLGSSVNVPEEIRGYVNSHDWWVEKSAGEKAAYTTNGKYSLLSYTDYMENRAAIGTSAADTGGGTWMFRSPASLSSAVFLEMKAGGRFNSRPIGNADSIWSAQRICFYVNSDFFRNVKLNTASLGDDVKAVLMRECTPKRATELGYTASERETIGYRELHFGSTFGKRTSTGKVYLSKAVTNESDVSSSITVRFAEYDSAGNLETVSESSANVPPKGTHVFNAVMDVGTQTNPNIRVFVWNSNLTPLDFAESALLSEITAPKLATAQLGDVIELNGFDSVEYESLEAPNVSHGGIEIGAGNKYIDFYTDRSIRRFDSDGSHYTLSVNYYDGGKGYFRVLYNSEAFGETELATVYTTGSKTYKTAEFVADDMLFADGKYDLRLAAYAKSTKSMVSAAKIPICSVTLTKEFMHNPIGVTTLCRESGNAFAWDDESKSVTNTFTNRTSEPVTANVTYKLTDADGIERYTQSKLLEFAAGESVTDEFEFGDLQRCDVYTLSVNTECNFLGESTLSEMDTCEMSILKTDSDGVLNDEVFIDTHFEYYGAQKAAEGIDVIRKANIGGARVAIQWDYVQRSKTELKYRDLLAKKIVDTLTSNGIETAAQLVTSSRHFGLRAWQIPGVTDTSSATASEQLAAWTDFASFISQELGEGITKYEIWNEPNIKSFNYDLADGTAYANMVNAASQAIKANNPDAKVGAMSLTYLSRTQDDTANGILAPGKYFNEAVSAGIGNHIDAVTLHPYGGGKNSVESRNLSETIRQYKDTLAENGKDNILVWNTELGYTTALTGDEDTKGKLNSRSAIHFKSQNTGNIQMFYNFAKKGTVATDQEDQFGMVSGGYDECKRYGKNFLPTRSYVMLAAHNYVMANAGFEQSFDSDNLYVSKFTSGKFGKKIVTLYRESGSGNVRMSLGANSVEVYDCMGNKTLLTSEDGVYVFNATDAPAYIVGDIAEVGIE